MTDRTNEVATNTDTNCYVKLGGENVPVIPSVMGDLKLIRGQVITWDTFTKILTLSIAACERAKMIEDCSSEGSY